MVILNYIFIAVGILSTSFMLFDNVSTESGVDIIVLGFWTWAIIPYLILIFANKHFTKTKTAKTLTSSAVAITVAGALFIYYDAFYVHLDAQNALLFIFLPVYQNILAAILSAIAAACSWIQKKQVK
ncbi:MAG: hypothetical protein ACYTGA_02125 [Planctomycetota bacterium]|jgi:uncharacterized membrane protein YGL010W